MNKLKENKSLTIGIGLILFIILGVIIMLATGILKISEAPPENVSDIDDSQFRLDEDFLGSSDEFLDEGNAIVTNLNNLEEVTNSVRELRTYKEILNIESRYLNSNYILQREITVDSLDDQKFYMRDRRGITNDAEGFNGSEYELFNSQSDKYLRINTKSPIDDASYPEGEWIQIPSNQYPELDNEAYQTFVDEFLVSTLPLFIQDLSSHQLLEQSEDRLLFLVSPDSELVERITLAYGFYANLSSSESAINLEVFLEEDILNYKLTYSNGEILYQITQLDETALNVDNIVN